MSSLPDLQIADFSTTVSGTQRRARRSRSATSAPARRRASGSTSTTTGAARRACGDIGDDIPVGLQPGGRRLQDSDLHPDRDPQRQPHELGAASTRLCTLSESDESNNTASTTYSVGGPRLPDLKVSLASAVSGTTVDLHRHRLQHGRRRPRPTSTSTSTTTSRPRRPAACWATFSDRRQPGGRAPAPRSASPAPPRPAGSYTAWARADSTCLLGRGERGQQQLLVGLQREPAARSARDQLHRLGLGRHGHLRGHRLQ